MAGGDALASRLTKVPAGQPFVPLRPKSGTGARMDNATAP